MFCALYNIKTNRKKQLNVSTVRRLKISIPVSLSTYTESFQAKHFEETRDVKTGATKAFPPEVLAGAVAADEIFFHVIP